MCCHGAVSPAAIWGKINHQDLLPSPGRPTRLLQALSQDRHRHGRRSSAAARIMDHFNLLTRIMESIKLPGDNNGVMCSLLTRAIIGLDGSWGWGEVTKSGRLDHRRLTVAISSGIIRQQSQYLAGDHLQHSCFLFHCVPLFRGMGGEVVSGGGGGVTGRDGEWWHSTTVLHCLLIAIAGDTTQGLLSTFPLSTHGCGVWVGQGLLSTIVVALRSPAPAGTSCRGPHCEYSELYKSQIKG